jgi:hypothetical protein
MRCQHCGQDTRTRKHFCHKCLRLPLCYLIIASAAADSDGKSDPGRYFCFTVNQRLREARMISTPSLED